jgi:hypothetical protein
MSGFSRSSLAAGILASNEMSGYEGCTKEEGEAVCQFIQKRIAGAQEDQPFSKVIYTQQHGGGLLGIWRKGLGLIGKDPERRPFGPLRGA